MGCVVVCAAGAGALDGVFAVALMALGFAVAAVLAAAAVSVLLGYAWVPAVVILAAGVLGSVATVRLIQYGCVREVFRRHRRPAERPAALERARVPVALPRGTHLAAIEQGKIYEVTPDMVLGKAKEEAR